MFVLENFNEILIRIESEWNLRSVVKNEDFFCVYFCLSPLKILLFNINWLFLFVVTIQLTIGEKFSFVFDFKFLFFLPFVLSLFPLSNFRLR